MTRVPHPERPDRLRAALAGVTAVDAELLSDSRAPRGPERSELELVHRPEMIDRVVRCGARRRPPGWPTLPWARPAWTRHCSRPERCCQLRSSLEPEQRSRGLLHREATGAPRHTGGVDGFCLFNSVAVGRGVAGCDRPASRRRRRRCSPRQRHPGRVLSSRRRSLCFDSPVPALSGHRCARRTRRRAGRGLHDQRATASGCHRRRRLGLRWMSDHSGGGGVRPDWLLISAGYDGHRADPLTGLCYSSSDYGDFVRRLMPLAPRTVAVLEGGYDLERTPASSYAVAGALLGLDLRPEPASSAGPGHGGRASRGPPRGLRRPTLAVKAEAAKRSRPALSAASGLTRRFEAAGHRLFLVGGVVREAVAAGSSPS